MLAGIFVGLILAAALIFGIVYLVAKSWGIW